MSTVAAFIDLKKAFDTLIQEILVNRRYHYGIRGMVLERIVIYVITLKNLYR